ncbi:MAG TPA: CPBP family intramembrane glutamic endopeptidase [Verrucomicrobiae bacterium]|nr:CPBP family intramembrane glutamic endopeptidase [Verrucomicrobiae bacterium]
MRASKAIGLYAGAVVVLGALSAPWLFWAVQWLAAEVPLARWLGAYPFRRVFSRALMIVAFAGLWPLLRNVGIRSWNTLGYASAAAWWKHVLIGFAIGLGSLVIALAVSVALGERSVALDRSAGEIVGAMLRYALVGVVVALIEETFFRGALQGVFQREMNVVVAVILASLIYSALHFLRPHGAGIAAEDVRWSSGFACLAELVTRSFAGRDVLISFVTLFLAGCILGLAYAKTGALYLSIGLHAGWVLANESARWLGAGKIVEDVIAWPVLALLLVLVQWLCSAKLKPLGVSEPSNSGRGARST